MKNSKPLTIFLFTSCSGSLCLDTRSLLLKYSKEIAEELSQRVSQAEGAEINVVIAEGRTLRGMNRRFRGIDAATDVLSFPLGDGVLGEIWICPSLVRRNARLFGQSEETELLRVCIHGMLHLFGYDHSGVYDENETKNLEEMFTLQEGILKAVISKKE